MKLVVLILAATAAAMASTLPPNEIRAVGVANSERHLTNELLPPHRRFLTEESGSGEEAKSEDSSPTLIIVVIVLAVVVVCSCGILFCFLGNADTCGTIFGDECASSIRRKPKQATVVPDP